MKLLSINQYLPIPPLLLAVLLGACSTVGSSQAPEHAQEIPDTPDITSVTPSLNSQQLRAIDSLLLKAEWALQENRLLTPISTSAYDYYEAVLSIDSANPDALLGLEKIVESYLVLALNAARNSQFAQADKMMQRARIAYNALSARQSLHSSGSNNLYSTDNLDSVASSINMLRGADRHRLLIERRALKTRDEDLALRLTTFGKQAKRPGIRAIILAPNDSAGRWIYQQLRKAPGEYRIRGEIQIGIPAQVELLSIDAPELL